MERRGGIARSETRRARCHRLRGREGPGQSRGDRHEGSQTENRIQGSPAAGSEVVESCRVNFCRESFLKNSPQRTQRFTKDESSCALAARGDLFGQYLRIANRRLTGKAGAN